MPKYLKRWLIRIAHSDYPWAGGMIYSPRFNSALYVWYLSKAVVNRLLIIVFYPVCFYFAFLVTPVILEYDLIVGIAAVTFIIWTLILYFTAIWWLWYKRKCDKVTNREDVKMVKTAMKRTLKFFPCWLSIHLMILLLLNILLLTRIKPEWIPVVVLLVLDILVIYYVSKFWIRMVTYPLRSSIIRETVRM